VCIATLPCETVTSENKRRLKSNAKINDKLQGTVGTHLRSGGSFNKQIKRGSLLSLPVKKIEIGKYLAYLRAKRWIVSCALFDF